MAEFLRKTFDMTTTKYYSCRWSAGAAMMATELSMVSSLLLKRDVIQNDSPGQMLLETTVQAV